MTMSAAKDAARAKPMIANKLNGRYTSTSGAIRRKFVCRGRDGTRYRALRGTFGAFHDASLLVESSRVAEQNPISVGAEVGGHIAEHRVADGIVGIAAAAKLHLARGIEEDLVLEDFLNYRGQLVPGADVDERTRAGVAARPCAFG